MKSCCESKACGNPLLLWKGHSLVTTLKEICQHIQNSSLEKNVLDTQQLQANQIDINSTVSSHLLGSPAQSCVKAWGTEPSRGRHCFPGRLRQGTGEIPGKVQQEGLDVSSWPHRASLKARWEQASCVNSTSNHDHLSLAEMMTSSWNWQHTHDNPHD